MFYIRDTGELVGLVTMNCMEMNAETISLNNVQEKLEQGSPYGIETMLIEQVEQMAKENKCNHIALQTNYRDNE